MLELPHLAMTSRQKDTWQTKYKAVEEVGIRMEANEFPSS
jgi:hypothetical protein